MPRGPLPSEEFRSKQDRAKLSNRVAMAVGLSEESHTRTAKPYMNKGNPFGTQKMYYFCL